MPEKKALPFFPVFFEARSLMFEESFSNVEQRMLNFRRIRYFTFERKIIPESYKKIPE